MNHFIKRLMGLLLATFLSSIIITPLWAVPSEPVWPDHPVRLVVPYPSGGMADVAARILGQRLASVWHQQVVVDNKPGAGGTIGSSTVAHSAPDGYTLLTVFDTHAATPYLYKLDYDPVTDLSPIALVAKSPMMLVCSTSFAPSNVAELLQFAKDHPSNLNFVTVGPGSPSRMMLELLKSATGINVTVVPYRGGGPAMVDLISGQVDAMIASVATVTPHIKNGRLKVLAVTSEKRSSLAPNVPAMSETIPGFGTDAWVGIMGPAKLPANLILKINKDINQVLKNADVKAILVNNGMDATPSTPEGLDQWIHHEMARWNKVIVEQNVTLN
jgi:tripartite-type tricarboxylate transporter receptor subunit TctC